MVSTGHPGRMSPDEFVERLKELVANNVAGSTELLTRFSDFVREASQAARSGRVGDRVDAEGMLSRLLDFNLASYSVISAQSLALLNGLLSAAQSTLLPRTAPASHARVNGGPPVDLRLSGRQGERAATSFVIENHFDRPLTVTFECSALVPTDGPTLPASLVKFQPKTLVTEPHGQGIVQAAITITADFVVGQTYTATIRPQGFETKEMKLSLSVLPPAVAPSQASPKRRSGKKRGSRVTK